MKLALAETSRMKRSERQHRGKQELLCIKQKSDTEPCMYPCIYRETKVSAHSLDF